MQTVHQHCCLLQSFIPECKYGAFRDSSKHVEKLKSTQTSAKGQRLHHTIVARLWALEVFSLTLPGTLMLTSVHIFKEPRLVKIAVIASHAFDSLLDAVSDCAYMYLL